MQLLSETCFIDNAENILITGATGCGKSYLACALGRQACIIGFKTIYNPMSRFIELIATSRIDGTYTKLLNTIAKIPLLILDDFGLEPLDINSQLTLLQILEDRYKKYPIVITSQLPVNEWHAYIGEPTIADAIMDRLSATYYRVELKSDSLGKNNSSIFTTVIVRSLKWFTFIPEQWFTLTPVRWFPSLRNIHEPC